LNETANRSILKQAIVGTEEKMRGFIWLTIAVLLLFAWIGSFIVYHVAGFLIHLLLIFALIALVIQVFTGRRAT
jgi:apolipoprotein N-acyltransferase